MAGDEAAEEKEEAEEENEAEEEAMDDVPPPLPRIGACSGERLLARDLRDEPWVTSKREVER